MSIAVALDESLVLVILMLALKAAGVEEENIVLFERAEELLEYDWSDIELVFISMNFNGGKGRLMVDTMQWENAVETFAIIEDPLDARAQSLDMDSDHMSFFPLEVVNIMQAIDKAKRRKFEKEN